MNINTNVKTVLTLVRTADGEECDIKLNYENATTLCVDMFNYEQDDCDSEVSEFNRFIADVEKNVSLINYGSQFKVKYMNVEDEDVCHFVLTAANINMYDNVMYVTVSKVDGKSAYYGVHFYQTPEEKVKLGKATQEGIGLRFLRLV